MIGLIVCCGLWSLTSWLAWTLCISYKNVEQDGSKIVGTDYECWVYNMSSLTQKEGFRANICANMAVTFVMLLVSWLVGGLCTVFAIIAYSAGSESNRRRRR